MREQAWTNGIPDPAAAYAVVDVYVLGVLAACSSCLNRCAPKNFS